MSRDAREAPPTDNHQGLLSTVCAVEELVIEETNLKLSEVLVRQMPVCSWMRSSGS